MRKSRWLTAVTAALVLLALVMHFVYRDAFYRTFHRDTDIFFILPVIPFLVAEFRRVRRDDPPQQSRPAPEQLREYS